MSRVIKAPFIKIDNENKVNIEVMTKNNFFVNDIDDEHAHQTAVVTSNMIIESANANANSIREGAKAEAENILRNAINKAYGEAEKIKQQAKEDALKEGYEEGFRKGEREANELIRKAKEYQASVEEECEILRHSVEPEAVSLIIDICKSIVGVNLKINPEAVVYAVRTGLSKVQRLTEVNIRVSQDDYETLLNRKEDILSTLDSSANIEIVRDSTLSTGDCVIETPQGDIDSSIMMQFESLIADLSVIINNG